MFIFLCSIYRHLLFFPPVSSFPPHIIACFASSSQTMLSPEVLKQSQNPMPPPYQHYLLSLYFTRWKSCRTLGVPGSHCRKHNLCVCVSNMITELCSPAALASWELNLLLSVTTQHRELHMEKQITIENRVGLHPV